MLTYCLTCRKNTNNEDVKMIKTKNGRIILSSKFAICDGEKSRYITDQEAKRLLSNLGIKTPLSKSPLLNILL